MFSAFFIDRPIFTTVVAVLIVIAGLVSMRALPVAQYPTITPVQIQVTTTYPGADSQTVAESVAAPIEAQINGVENMLYMSSTSSNTGQMTITVYFSLDTDPDIAQVLVQNRVNLALPQLPDAVKNFGISVQKQSSSTLMVIAVYDKEGHYTQNYVTTYANLYLLDAIKRVNGAGQSQIFGVPDQAMRIWMNPDRMASLEITTSDIKTAISEQNALFGAGQVGAQPSSKETQQTFPVVTQRPFVTPEEYENIILKASANGNAIVRVKDVARAEVGRKQYIGENYFNGINTTAIVVYQQPGANGLDVSASVRKTLKDMERTMPKGIEYVIALDTTDFIRISIKEVLVTLVQALLLVIAVVYIFVQNFPATIICTTAIIVSLVGTFTGMYALGFSINLLTLFGLVLAIGIVVDDAIVVVENVERNMHEDKLSLNQAVKRAMQEVMGPVIASALVLAAVFVPAAFIPGTTGQLYKQFAITIVISSIISSFAALTLTPTMCGVMLAEHIKEKKGFFRWFNLWFGKLISLYGKSVNWILQHPIFTLIPLIAFFGLILFFFNSIPTSFVPQEDQGYVMAEVLMPDAASLERTIETTQQIDDLFAGIPAVQSRTIINGFSLIDSQYKQNTATFFITLKDFEERYASLKTAKQENARAVLKKVMLESQDVLSGIFVPIPPPPIPGIGTSGGVEFWILNKGSEEPAELGEITQKFLEEAKKRPEFLQLNSTFKASAQQLRADVNREKSVLLDVPIESVYSTVQAQFGSLQVSQYEQYSRTWDVILQSDALFRDNPEDVTKLYTRSINKKMIPLDELVTTKYTTGPDLMPHFNGFPAAQVTAQGAPGYSSGDVIQAMEEVAQKVLPENYDYAWSGMAYQEKESGGTASVAFIFGLLIVFLILSAQYESWSLPGSVITAVPFGVFGALLATYLRGLDNDVYFQIGLLVLVGLAAKNAILIVEFAVDLRNQGLSIKESAVKAGELRLRPIVMTSLSFVFGVFPLVIASGAGANARHSIGTGVLGGMIAATTLALLYVPLFYSFIQKLSEKRKTTKEGQGV